MGELGNSEGMDVPAPSPGTVRVEGLPQRLCFLMYSTFPYQEDDSEVPRPRPSPEESASDLRDPQYQCYPSTLLTHLLCVHVNYTSKLFGSKPRFLILRFFGF